MNLGDILSYLGGLFTANASDAQKAAAAKWALLALKAWDAYGALSTQFKAVADKVQALKDAGWQLNDVVAEYGAAEAGLQADFDALKAAQP